MRVPSLLIYLGIYLINDNTRNCRYNLYESLTKIILINSFHAQQYNEKNSNKKTAIFYLLHYNLLRTCG